jgi:hypothetical protein
MNYSASENYHRQCTEISKKKIQRSQIRKRWFKNYYALHTISGLSKHNFWVLKAGQFDPKTYVGDFYGPFFHYEQAKAYGLLICDIHTSFRLGE